jgi:hypothetical protein
MNTSFSDFLNETKNTKIIYHFTESVDSLNSILYDDALIEGSYNHRYGLGYDNISFTWNPNLWDIEYLGDTRPRWSVRIALDYNKMSEKWNFKPFDYGIDEEMEEIIESDTIDNISDYIIDISISSQEPKNQIEDLKIDYPNIKIKTVRRKKFKYD